MLKWFESLKNIWGPSKPTRIAENLHHLKWIIEDEIKKHGPAVDLNHVDVSRLTSLHSVFCRSPFCGDISKWNVSNIEDFSQLFMGSQISCDLSQWNTSKVKTMHKTFAGCKKIPNISEWNVSNVEDMQGMFSQTFVDIDLSKWNTARVQNMHDMFCLSSVQGDFSSWNTSKVKNMNGMFSHARVNANISTWDVSSVNNFTAMFLSAEAAVDLSGWKLSHYVQMSQMFQDTSLLRKFPTIDLTTTTATTTKFLYWRAIHAPVTPLSMEELSYLFEIHQHNSHDLVYNIYGDMLTSQAFTLFENYPNSLYAMDYILRHLDHFPRSLIDSELYSFLTQQKSLMHSLGITENMVQIIHQNWQTRNIVIPSEDIDFNLD